MHLAVFKLLPKPSHSGSELTILQAGFCRLHFLGNLAFVRFVLSLLSTTASKLVVMLLTYCGEVGE
jgi:hypothetical protein